MTEFSANLIIPNFAVVSTAVVTIETGTIFSIIPPPKTPNFAFHLFQILSYGLL